MSSDLYSTHFTTAGYIAFGISSLIICIFGLVTFMSFMLKREVIKQQIKALFFCFLMALSVWSFLWDPAPYYDSYRHFQWLEQMRYQNLSLLDFLRNGFIGNEIGNYYGLITFNIIRYIVVRISSDNHILPFICTAIDYVIFYYVLIDFMEREKLNFRWLFLICVMSFSFMSYFMVVAGIRNALAASIVGLAIYNRLYKKHNFIEYVFLSTIAVTVHLNVILPILIAIIYPFFKGIRSLFIYLFGILFFRFGYTLLKASGIAFLSYIGSTIEFYVIENEYYGELITYISDIIVIVCCFLLLVRKNKALTLKEKSKNITEAYTKNIKFDKCIRFTFVYLSALLAMAFIGGTNFLTRECYVLGILSVFIVNKFSKLDYSMSTGGLVNKFLITVIVFASLVNIGSEFILLLAQFFN